MTVTRLDLSDVLGPSPRYAYLTTASGATCVYTAGAVPLDEHGDLVGEGDLEAQTRAVIANLARALDSARVSPDDIVKTTIYVVGDQPSLKTVWQVFETTPYAEASSTLVGATCLGYEGQLVEIEAIAVID